MQKIAVLAIENSFEARWLLFAMAYLQKRIRKMKFQNIKKRETGEVPAYYTWRDGPKSGLMQFEYPTVRGLPRMTPDMEGRLVRGAPRACPLIP